MYVLCTFSVHLMYVVCTLFFVNSLYLSKKSPKCVHFGGSLYFIGSSSIDSLFALDTSKSSIYAFKLLL